LTVTVLGSGGVPGAVYCAPMSPVGTMVPTVVSPPIWVSTHHERWNPGFVLVNGTDVILPGVARQSGSVPQFSGGGGRAPRAKGVKVCVWFFSSVLFAGTRKYWPVHLTTMRPGVVAAGSRRRLPATGAVSESGTRVETVCACVSTRT